jgi:hypothetical protein
MRGNRDVVWHGAAFSDMPLLPFLAAVLENPMRYGYSAWFITLL